MAVLATLGIAAIAAIIAFYVLLPNVFTMILGFGSDRYLGPQ